MSGHQPAERAAFGDAGMAECADVVVTWHRGLGFVIVEVNDRYRAYFPGRDVIGMPSAEAFPEPMYDPLRVVMRMAMLTGKEQWCRFRGGLFGARPWFEDGRLVGVVSGYRPPKDRPMLRVLPPDPRSQPDPKGARLLPRVG